MLIVSPFNNLKFRRNNLKTRRNKRIRCRSNYNIKVGMNKKIRYLKNNLIGGMNIYQLIAKKKKLNQTNQVVKRWKC